MASEEIRRLRNEVQKKRQAASNKISRTKRTTGANLAGTDFDPRRASGVESNYNARQLRTYLNNLNDFMRRTNQFVSGQEGAPIPRGYFQGVYKKNEAAVDAIRRDRENRLGNIPGPDGFKLKEFREALPNAGGSSKYGPYRKFDRESVDIKDFSALQKLNADMVKRLKPDYIDKEINSGRSSVEQVADYIGRSDIADDIAELTDDQFDLIWFGTTFAARLFMYYDLEKERQDANYKERNQDRVIESQFAGLGDLIAWAREQSPEN